MTMLAKVSCWSPHREIIIINNNLGYQGILEFHIEIQTAILQLSKESALCIPFKLPDVL
jgi:hypothetical protein